MVLRLRWIDIDAYEETPDRWGVRVDIDPIVWLEYQLAKARYERELEKVKAIAHYHFGLREE